MGSLRNYWGAILQGVWGLTGRSASNLKKASGFGSGLGFWTHDVWLEGLLGFRGLIMGVAIFVNLAATVQPLLNPKYTKP